MPRPVIEERKDWVLFDGLFREALALCKALCCVIPRIWDAIPDPAVLNSESFTALSKLTTDSHAAWSSWIDARGLIRHEMIKADPKAAHECLMRDIHLEDTKAA
jgi:LPS sulfotransferase NodH